tara:strand:- start:254 stop:535 length:282 start_codon:yes stop_codon:yes gene_type:complete
MKTRFLISSVISDQCAITADEHYLKSYIRFYEKNFKDDGFLVDEHNEDFYIIFEEEFSLEKDEQIQISGNDFIVDWKMTDITRKIITYSLSMI